jgi:hypothetical protein
MPDADIVASCRGLGFEINIGMLLPFAGAKGRSID